jgi:hypothetical protein
MQLVLKGALFNEASQVLHSVAELPKQTKHDRWHLKHNEDPLSKYPISQGHAGMTFNLNKLESHRVQFDCNIEHYKQL